MIWINAISGVLGKLLLPLISYFKGRSDAENKQLKEEAKELKKTRKIHDKLERDPVYRERVRKYFDR